MIGTVVSHYQILEKLGEGGMGVVYKARDLTLDRVVALKFLLSHVSITPEIKNRFLQEAKAAAALNHPHICTVHGVESDGENMFIAMGFIEGGTLRSVIPYPSVDGAVLAAIQIGEALEEAHAKGIVHRDIKSDNIMLTFRGQPKVMDFGLAKLRGSLRLTNKEKEAIAIPPDAGDRGLRVLPSWPEAPGALQQGEPGGNRDVQARHRDRSGLFPCLVRSG